jgi:glycerol dehydrogenase
VNIAEQPNYRLFGSPHRYLQGPLALEALPEWTDRLGGKPLFIADEFAWSLVSQRLSQAYGTRDGAATLPHVNIAGEITHRTIADNTDAARRHSPSVIIGLGGGKALDMGKAVSHSLGCPVITVPTIASTDAPTSNSFAIYNDEHRLIAVERMPRNPELVLVDTTIIVQAPARFLRAGIGDAIAKKFEGEAASNAGANSSHKTRPLRIGLAIGDFCYQTIRAFAADALVAVEAHQVSPALENVVEACILGSGLGFENTGLSIAHAMTRGLMASSGTRQAMHGEHVAYGLLVQLLLEERPAAFIDDLVDFYDTIGLPRTLRHLGQNAAVTKEVVDSIVEPTMGAPHIINVPKTVNEARLTAAIHALESRSSLK